MNAEAHDAHLSRLPEDDVPVSGRSQPRPEHPVVIVDTSHRTVLRLGSFGLRKPATPFGCICGLTFLNARALVEHVREARDAA